MKVTSKQVSRILQGLFEKAAVKNEVALQKMHLVFQLNEDYNGFYCKYGTVKVDIGIAGSTVRVLRNRITTFLTSALLNHSITAGIDKNKVNILMKYEEIFGFELFLRNGGTVIRSITVDEFLKI